MLPSKHSAPKYGWGTMAVAMAGCLLGIVTMVTQVIVVLEMRDLRSELGTKIRSVEAILDRHERILDTKHPEGPESGGDPDAEVIGQNMGRAQREGHIRSKRSPNYITMPDGFTLPIGLRSGCLQGPPGLPGRDGRDGQPGASCQCSCERGLPSTVVSPNTMSSPTEPVSYGQAARTTEVPTIEATTQLMASSMGTTESVTGTKGQVKFTTSGIFVVPTRVTTVDVICVGGGGGGRINTDASSYGGNGGNSSFGTYLTAEGGKGAATENNGGEGGKGSVADGGQGGVGGLSSAGAGAAGQTSGGGGGRVAGSSTHPFCGAGGSSVGPAGTSGPGGENPVGRSGGQYGGGGGSFSGGRAGGGGGYSRATIRVSLGERIAVTVGQAGTPYYAKPGDGVVVISWGGPIDPTGDMDTCPHCSDCPCALS